MCGADRVAEARYCRRCGYDLLSPPENAAQWKRQKAEQWASYSYYQNPPYQYQPGAPRVEKKEPVVTVLLSFLLPGLGQIYAGKLGRGLIVMVVYFLLTILFTLVFLAMGLWGGIGSWSWMPSSEAFFAWMAVSSIVLLVYYIWQIYDAYKCAMAFNSKAQTPGG